jgi:hypothetical protein
MQKSDAEEMHQHKEISRHITTLLVREVGIGWRLALAFRFGLGQDLIFVWYLIELLSYIVVKLLAMDR